MQVVCWSPKGGSGTSVATIGLALAAHRPHLARATVVVDLAGDLPAIVGLEDPPVGLAEWFAEPSAFELEDLLTASPAGLSILPRGSCALPDSRSGAWSKFALELASWSSRDRTVIIDAGRRPAPQDLHRNIDRSYIVVRPCYLALRRARGVAKDHHGVLVVDEHDRVLTTSDIGSVLDAPVVAVIPMTRDIARRVDAGIIDVRPPPQLLSVLTPVVQGWGNA